MKLVKFKNIGLFMLLCLGLQQLIAAEIPAESDEDCAPKVRTLVADLPVGASILAVKPGELTIKRPVATALETLSLDDLLERIGNAGDEFTGDARFARELMKTLGAVDLGDPKIQEQLALKVDEANVNYMESVGIAENQSIFQNTIARLSTSELGDRIAKPMTEMDQVITKLNVPSRFDAPPDSFVARQLDTVLSVLGRDVVRARLRKFFIQFSTINGVLDKNEGLVKDALDDEKKAIKEIYIPEANAIVGRMTKAASAYSVFKGMLDKSEELLTTLNTDSEGALFLRSEVLPVLARSTQMWLEVFNTLAKSRIMLVEGVKSGRDVIDMTAMSIFVNRIHIESGVMVAGFIDSQGKMMKVAKAYRATGNKVSEEVVNAFAAHLKDITGFEMDTSAVESLLTTSQTMMTAINERKQAQEAIVAMRKTNIEKLEGLAKDLTKFMDEQTKSLSLRDRVQLQAGKNLK